MGICMVTYFCDINLFVEGIPVQLLHIREMAIKCQVAGVDFSVNHGVKNESIIGAG